MRESLYLQTQKACAAMQVRSPRGRGDDQCLTEKAHLPAMRHSSFFSGSTAGTLELQGTAKHVRHKGVARSPTMVYLTACRIAMEQPSRHARWPQRPIRLKAVFGVSKNAACAFSHSSRAVDRSCAQSNGAATQANRVTTDQVLYAARKPVGQAHAQRLDCGRHRVGRVHAAARARPRARVLHDVLPLLLSDQPRRKRALCAQATPHIIFPFLQFRFYVPMELMPLARSNTCWPGPI